MPLFVIDHAVTNSAESRFSNCEKHQLSRKKTTRDRTRDPAHCKQQLKKRALNRERCSLLEHIPNKRRCHTGSRQITEVKHRRGGLRIISTWVSKPRNTPCCSAEPGMRVHLTLRGSKNRLRGCIELKTTPLPLVQGTPEKYSS